TKKELLELLDYQIIKSEVGGDIAHEHRQKAYQNVESERKSGQTKERWGFISETIVRNFLKKLSIDQDAPFQIREADVFQDVEQKIDFIIHRNQRLRGVDVEVDDKAKDVGIQFSINTREAERKKYQVEKSKKRLKESGESIDDIVLVIFPFLLPANFVKIGKRSGDQPVVQISFYPET
ncbi:MAG: hypothetical protein AAB621_02350, partial [Patescibacteria group bacterium]